jgi:carboxyl-terminal processing protease
MPAPLSPAGGEEPAHDEPSRDEADLAVDAQRGAGPDRTEPSGPADTAPERRHRVSAGSSRFATFLVAVLVAGSIFLGGYTLGAHVATTPGTPASEESRFAPFWDVYSLIQSSFAGSPKPSPDALVRAAIDGMMKSLNDPYSYYQAPADFQNTLQSVGGQAVGVGIQIQLQPVDPKSTAECTKIGGGCELAVVEPIPGSPAEKAGVKAGDVLVSVNGTALDGLTVDQASALIKGDKGTKATLTIDRAGQRLDIAIVRDLFDLPEVATRSLADGKVEYISLSQFGNPAAQQFHDALAAGLKVGARSIIIDLRGNPGGLVTGADAIASEFISSGTIVYQVDAGGTETAISAKPGGLATDPSIKLAVLVDQNSASASEILAGALQARGRAVLVGDHTFGKGIFQVYLPLPNDAGGIHLTTGRWLTPNHVSIQGKGLQPDVPVSSANARAGEDPVLDAALVKLGYAAQSAPSPSASPAPSAGPSGPAVSSSPSPSPSASAS